MSSLHVLYMCVGKHSTQNTTGSTHCEHDHALHTEILQLKMCLLIVICQDIQITQGYYHGHFKISQLPCILYVKTE